MEQKRSDSWPLIELAHEAEKILMAKDFHQLECLKHLPQIIPYPHQIKTAQRVISEMRGRAILADEVGLGKTIEAGLIIKEYMLRGLVKKILILVPASLVLQWTRELNEKFAIQATAHRKHYSWDADIVVASLDTAKREDHLDIILSNEYDMLIIDEAHKLKNRKTKNWQNINKIKKKYCLLLTATPVQNSLDELFNLITLLKPGQLGNYTDFLQNFVEKKRKPKNKEDLKKLIDKVMIRNKRRDGGVEFVARHVHTTTVELSDEERNLYDAITDFIRNHRDLNMLSLLTLQREVCSSTDATFLTLVHMLKSVEQGTHLDTEIRKLIDICRTVKRIAKAEKLVEIIKNINDKVIVFTEYRATQEFLQMFLAHHKISSVPYRGGFKRGKKEWMKDLFFSRAQVMVATEAGGEGINLQFCNNIINYDLPWNPMRIEQRIGRVHRLGQSRDVHIYNFSTKDTIEEHILFLLQEKINMFEMVIGELDSILAKLNMPKGQKLESSLLDLVYRTENKEELNAKINELGEKILEAKKELEKESACLDILN
ncbi:ATP-dependent helicase [Desulfuribacillus stibiiarsenatis]|uniref:ATP-dependent helicase n=1 Tax=Desulfuribacillus stibiiarsenatis TaxID=1390249 RepID=A0A1E5L702_9FIRM|nr:ATP-dependent helicase [Desulfuribacillus stibiiarsenatis]